MIKMSEIDWESELDLLEEWLIAEETGDEPLGIDYPSLKTAKLWGITLPKYQEENKMLNDNTENQNKEIQDFNTAVVHGLSDEAYLDDKLPDSHSIRKEKNRNHLKIGQGIMQSS